MIQTNDPTTAADKFCEMGLAVIETEAQAILNLQSNRS